MTAASLLTLLSIMASLVLITACSQESDERGSEVVTGILKGEAHRTYGSYIEPRVSALSVELESGKRVIVKIDDRKEVRRYKGDWFVMPLQKGQPVSLASGQLEWNVAGGAGLELEQDTDGNWVLVGVKSGAQ